MEEKDLTGKFVVVHDTICEGEQTAMTEENMPVLYNSADEAFKELFDDAHSMLDNRTEEELEEYNEGVTPEMVTEMGRLLELGDVTLMRQFLEWNPQCNDNEEFVLPAEEFIQGRKAIYTGS